MSVGSSTIPSVPSSIQQQSLNNVDWIGAYMEWMDLDWTDRSGSPEEASAGSNEQFVVAYFEWLELSRPSVAKRQASPATAYYVLPAFDRFGHPVEGGYSVIPLGIGNQLTHSGQEYA